MVLISSTRSALCLIGLVWNHKDVAGDYILWNRRCLTLEPIFSSAIICGQTIKRTIRVSKSNLKEWAAGKWALLHWHFRAVRRISISKSKSNHHNRVCKTSASISPQLVAYALFSSLFHFLSRMKETFHHLPFPLHFQNQTHTVSTQLLRSN